MKQRLKQNFIFIIQGTVTLLNLQSKETSKEPEGKEVCQ